MRFTVDQRYGTGPDELALAYADPDLYDHLVGLPNLGAPEVLAHRRAEQVVDLEIRYRFTGELSAAARAVLDPSRLTWVERSRHDLSGRTTSFEMTADHYADRFRCRGTYRFAESERGSVRHCEGDLRVKALLVAGAVEGAIVSGLKEYLAAEAPVVEAFVAQRSA